jgi:hypothetical protein|tara:strand:+ start:249 stop:389 length:141 start_codon:yes stop_codon:yes gene_type:complete
MPLPKPKSQENRKEFMTRCMADPTMVKEYTNIDQRLAVCAVQYKNK